MPDIYEYKYIIIVNKQSQGSFNTEEDAHKAGELAYGKGNFKVECKKVKADLKFSSAAAYAEYLKNKD